MERQLYKSQRNKELIQLLDLEKSLVYFNTSLKANEVTLEKILRGRIITLYEEDHDLLEDVLIEDWMILSQKLWFLGIRLQEDNGCNMDFMLEREFWILCFVSFSLQLQSV